MFRSKCRPREIARHRAMLKAPLKHCDARDARSSFIDKLPLHVTVVIKAVLAAFLLRLLEQLGGARRVLEARSKRSALVLKFNSLGRQIGIFAYRICQNLCGAGGFSM